MNNRAKQRRQIDLQCFVFGCSSSTIRSSFSVLSFIILIYDHMMGVVVVVFFCGRFVDWLVKCLSFFLFKCLINNQHLLWMLWRHCVRFFSSTSSQFNSIMIVNHFLSYIYFVRRNEMKYILLANCVWFGYLI